MRYYTASGSNPEETKACFFIQGPQDEEQVSPAIRELLNLKGVTHVEIRYNHGLGPRIDVYSRIIEADAKVAALMTERSELVQTIACDTSHIERLVGEVKALKAERDVAVKDLADMVASKPIGPTAGAGVGPA